MRPRGTFAEAWRLYRAHVRRVLAIAAAAHVVLFALAGLLVAQAGAAGYGIAGLLWLAGSFWLQAPLAQLVRDVTAGRPPPGPRATFDRIVPHTGAISLAAVLAGIGVGVGYMLFVVPGLFLLTRWSLLVPVIVVEEVGAFRAFARSRDLVRGHGWRVFGTIVATVALLFAAVLGIGALTGVAAGFGLSGETEQEVAGIVSAFVVLTLVSPFIALVWTLRYLAYRAERHPRPAVLPTYLAVGDTLDDAWELYKRHPSRLLALGAGVAVLALAAALLPLGPGVRGLVLVAAALAGFVVLAGVVAEGLETYADAPPRPWLRERLAATGRCAGALAALALAGGVLFATVVGLVVLPWLAVAAPIVTVERRGLRAALGRSRALVHGHVGRVVKLVALSLVVAALVPVGVAILVPPVGVTGGLVIAAVAVALTAPYVALAWALAYRRLRELEDMDAAIAAAAVGAAPPAS